MTRRERLEAKLEKREAWADSREASAAARFDKAHQIGDSIPFGQPILVGHHSEKRARRDADRIWSNMGKGVEDLNMAEHHASKAQGIARQLAGSIFSDDPDAVEALEARIASLEAERDQIKAENAAFRKTHKDELKTLTAYGRDQIMPHPSYRLSNLSGNIKRNKDRLAQIKTQQERAQKAEQAGGVTVEEIRSTYTTYARVTFAEKPAREVLTALKAAGFRWGSGSWTGELDKLPEGITN